MPYVDENIIYTDDGEPAGEIVQAEDGNYVAISLDGEILDAASPDGTPIDPSGYELDTGSDEYAALQAQVADLQAQMETQQWQHQPEQGGMSDDQAAQIIATNFDQLAQKAGRELTGREVETVLSKMQDQLDAGRTPDFDRAAADVNVRPV